MSGVYSFFPSFIHFSSRTQAFQIEGTTNGLHFLFLLFGTWWDIWIQTNRLKKGGIADDQLSWGSLAFWGVSGKKKHLAIRVLIEKVEQTWNGVGPVVNFNLWQILQLDAMRQIVASSQFNNHSRRICSSNVLSSEITFIKRSPILRQMLFLCLDSSK